MATRTIGNPISWAFSELGGAAGYAADVTGQLAAAPGALPVVRKLSVADLRRALGRGFDDLVHFRSDVAFLCLLYPLVGAAMAVAALRGDMVQLLFPLLSGFALVGPVAAVGMYEMSRRRELGQDAGWASALAVLRSPRFGAILVLALFHVVIFLAWIMAADLIHRATMGPDTPRAAGAFLAQVLGTPGGWAMIVLGIGVGFLFAAVVLATSVVSFPLLLDRNVGLVTAVVTSVRVAVENPVVIGMWGLIVAAGLVAGTLPFLIGLVLVLPALGHATWHLYRAAVG